MAQKRKTKSTTRAHPFSKATRTEPSRTRPRKMPDTHTLPSPVSALHFMRRLLHWLVSKWPRPNLKGRVNRRSRWITVTNKRTSCNSTNRSKRKATSRQSSRLRETWSTSITRWLICEDDRDWVNKNREAIFYFIILDEETGQVNRNLKKWQN